MPIELNIANHGDKPQTKHDTVKTVITANVYSEIQH